MKNKGLVLTSVVVLSVLVLGGCSTSNNKNSNAKSSAEKVTATYYQNLSKADKKNVQFKFTLSQDETKDNSADPVYMVSMTVTNKTNKTLKFHKDKFIYTLPEDKILSSGNGILSIQPGKSKTIDQMFDNVPEQGTLGDGVIEYLNNTNKLAYAKFVNNIATSSNLNDKDLSKNNESTTGNSSTESRVSSSSAAKASSATAQSSSTTATTTSASSSNSHQTEAAAALDLQSRADMLNLGINVSSMTAKDLGTGWSFTDSSGSTWIMNDDASCSGPGF